MRYLGGKMRHTKWLKPTLSLLFWQHGCMSYYEPFVGGGSVIAAMSHLPTPRIGCDINASLILLLDAAANHGYVPTADVTREEWQRLKDDPAASKEKAWAGFAASYAGKWFQGFVGDKYRPSYLSPTTYLHATRTTFLRRVRHLRGVAFHHRPYTDTPPLTNALIYCDPPYASTTEYNAARGFDSAAFWEWAAMMSQHNCVVVSEWAAPDGWEPVVRVNSKTQLANAKAERVESLWKYGG